MGKVSQIRFLQPFLIFLTHTCMQFPIYRTPTAALTFLVSGLACGVIAFLPEGKIVTRVMNSYDDDLVMPLCVNMFIELFLELVWLRVTFSLIGKLFITGAFAVICIVIAELYPTSERATGYAAAALMGRIGSIAAPYVALMVRLRQPEEYAQLSCSFVIPS